MLFIRFKYLICVSRRMEEMNDSPLFVLGSEAKQKLAEAVRLQQDTSHILFCAEKHLDDNEFSINTVNVGGIGTVSVPVSSQVFV